MKSPNLEGCIAAERAPERSENGCDQVARGARKYAPRTICWSRTADVFLRSMSRRGLDMPFTPKILFSAAVVQQTVGPESCASGWAGTQLYSRHEY